MPQIVASFAAGSPLEIVQSFGKARLTIRHPIDVFHIVWFRGSR